MMTSDVCVWNKQRLEKTKQWMNDQLNSQMKNSQIGKFDTLDDSEQRWYIPWVVYSDALRC